MDTFYTDLLCVGAGLAGERVAVAAAEAGFGAICLSIVPPRRSHSSAAQGGMQASLGNCCMGEGDCPDVHFSDTVKGSDWDAIRNVRACSRTPRRLPFAKWHIGAFHGTASSPEKASTIKPENNTIRLRRLKWKA